MNLTDNTGNSYGDQRLVVTDGSGKPKQNGLGYTAENVANKKTTMTGNETSNVFYLTAKAVYDWAIGLFVPKTRNITINGTTQDLSSDRTWTVTSSAAWGGITGTLSSQTDLQTALDGKVDENVAIPPATKTKITYDAKGLVTSGTDATTADISDSLNKRYVTDAQQTVINNTRGTNTGDETTVSIQTKRPIKTVNSQSLEGIGDVTISATPAGSSSQIQYNNSGLFAGAANVNIQDDELALPNISNPTTPTNAIKLYGKQLANKFFITTKETNGLENFIQESLFKNSVLLIKPAGNSATVTAIGAAALIATGTATAANVAVTNLHTQMKRIDYLVTTPATNAVAGFRTNVPQYFRGTASTEGGFFFHGYWGPATGVATTTNRASFGMHANQTVPTDVEPSTILNQLAMGWDAADTNIQIMSNQGTGTATKKDLGASFPVPTLDTTHVYELSLWCPPGSATIWYSVTDMVTGANASGTITSRDRIPANTVLMGPKGWMSVGGTSSVIGISFMSIHVFTKY